MANENEAGSFNLEPGSNETLTGTWTWAGPDGESKVIVQSPTETTELTGGSVILNDRASGEKGRIQITNDDNNLILRANNELYFNDSTQANPISLSQIGNIVGSGRPGGNVCGNTNDYLRRNVDEAITGTYTWTGEDAESKITVQSPTETTQITGGSVILTDRSSGESGRLVITTY